MPVWWYPFSSIRWSPASTRVALVGALGLGRASAVACSAMCYLLSRNNRPVDYYCQVLESKYSKCDRVVMYLHPADKYRRLSLSTIIGTKSSKRKGFHGIPVALSPLVTPSQLAVRTHRPHVSSRQPVAPSPALSASRLRWLRPRRHPKEQYLPEGPHPICQPSGHRWCPRPPLRG